MERKDGETRPKIRDVFEYLIQRSGKNLNEIAAECGVPYQTLYNIRTRNSARTSLRTLKVLADYFDEDVTIFLGLEGYRKPLRPTRREEELLESYRRLSDKAQSRADDMVADMAANPKNRR